MPQIPQSLDTDATFILRFGRQTVQPIEYRNGLSILLIEDNRNPGPDGSLDVRIIANLGQAIGRVKTSRRDDQSWKWKESKEPCRDLSPENQRDRARDLWAPRLSYCPYKISGVLADSPSLTSIFWREA